MIRSMMKADNGHEAGAPARAMTRVLSIAMLAVSLCAALALLGHPPLLPVHWGTFALALHDWDQPAERLLELAPHAGVHLVMPRLGEAVQPAQAERVRPWWRQGAAPAAAPPPAAEPAPPLTPEQVARLDWPGD